MKDPCVYIMSNEWLTIYIGVTSDLIGRVYEDKNGVTKGFTSRYLINRLVYFEDFPDMLQAIAREKQIKGWRRSRKITLIDSTNPAWRDLSADWAGLRPA